MALSRIKADFSLKGDLVLKADLALGLGLALRLIWGSLGAVARLALIIRSYHGENVRSRPISETKHLWANSVLTWGTSWESLVLNVFCRPDQRIGAESQTPAKWDRAPGPGDSSNTRLRQPA